MSQNSQNNAASKIVQRLSHFLEEGDENETIEEVRARLAEEKIDTRPLKVWAKNRVGALKAERILSGAKKERSLLLDAFQRCKAKLGGTALPLKRDILERIKMLGESDPGAAQVFCRKFEEASDEDLLGLNEDLTRLDNLVDQDPRDDERT